MNFNFDNNFAMYCQKILSLWLDNIIINLKFLKLIMGRGDKKTAKGKTFRGSYGKSRPNSKKITKKEKPVAQVD